MTSEVIVTYDPARPDPNYRNPHTFESHLIHGLLAAILLLAAAALIFRPTSGVVWAMASVAIAMAGVVLILCGMDIRRQRAAEVAYDQDPAALPEETP
jgi:hypothetical protein